MPPKGYKHLKVLSKGQATTCLAVSHDDGREVVIKTLELKNISSWKGIELFEREVNVLQQLDHPSIPKFIDFIKDEHEGAKRWHIVQEKIAGEKLDPTSSWSEDDLRTLAKSVLESLVYLQSFSPPLLHRDVKPDNLIRKEKGYALIDFGSVRHVIPSDVGGSTVVGTSGYMAPEQLMGRADTSSDLYGLGMTLIHLISGKHPDDLEKKRMVLQWSQYQNKLHVGFIEFVNKLSEPHSENRFKNASEALDGMKPIGPPKNLIRRSKSWVTIKTRNDALVIRGIQLRFCRRSELVELPRIGFSGIFVCIFPIVVLLIIKGFSEGDFFASSMVSLFMLFFFAMCFLKSRIIRSTLVWTGSSVQIRGLIGKEGLSKFDQIRLNREVNKFHQKYKDLESQKTLALTEAKVETENRNTKKNL